MAQRITKICDRCGAEHNHTGGSPLHVQQVEWLVPTGLSDLNFNPRKTDLCQSCRKELDQLLELFMSGKLTPA